MIYETVGKIGSSAHHFLRCSETTPFKVQINLLNRCIKVEFCRPCLLFTSSEDWNCFLNGESRARFYGIVVLLYLIMFSVFVKPLIMCISSSSNYCMVSQMT
ncbi:hypothetical protein ABFS83_14G142700 [Erythranthe nasuta]